jgi:hypothetical protein
VRASRVTQPDARDAKAYIDLKVCQVVDEIRQAREKVVDQVHKIAREDGGRG